MLSVRPCCWFGYDEPHQALLNAAYDFPQGNSPCQSYRQIAEAWAAGQDPGGPSDHQREHGARLLIQPLVEASDPTSPVLIRRGLWWWKARIVTTSEIPTVRLLGRYERIWAFPKSVWPLVEALAVFQAASDKKRKMSRV